MPPFLFFKGSQASQLCFSKALPRPCASPTHCLDPRVSAAAGDGVAVLRHSAIYLSECFASGLKLSWALAVSWKPLNLVPNAAKDIRSNEDKQDSTCFSILLNSFTPVNACVWDGKQSSARCSSEQLQRGWESQGQLFYFPDLYQCSICTMTSPTSGLPPALCGV